MWTSAGYKGRHGSGQREVDFECVKFRRLCEPACIISPAHTGAGFHSGKACFHFSLARSAFSPENTEDFPMSAIFYGDAP